MRDDHCFEQGLGFGDAGHCATRPHRAERPGMRDRVDERVSHVTVGGSDCDDDRIGRPKARHGAPPRPGKRAAPHGGLVHAAGPARYVDGPRGRCAPCATGHGPSLRVGPPPPTGRRPHVWVWGPRVRRWLHAEPVGGLEVVPGHVVPHRGKQLPPDLFPRGFPRMHVTPPNVKVHHNPPPPPPPGHSRRPHTTHAPSVHVPGHYGWSAVEKRHTWIGAHDNSQGIDTSYLPPELKSAVEGAMKHSLKHTHAKTVWGVTGARVQIIPGHWAYDKRQKKWVYVEPHTNQHGAPTTTRYDIADAPSAAFGPRPRHVPPLHFWPDAGGFLKNHYGQRPSDAGGFLRMPAHAKHAKAHGLLDPAIASRIMGDRAALERVLY